MKAMISKILGLNFLEDLNTGYQFGYFTLGSL